MTEKIPFTQFEDSFKTLQDTFEGQIATEAYHEAVTQPSGEMTVAETRGDFTKIDTRLTTTSALVGRILLLPYGRAFSPAILTTGEQGDYQITWLEQEYDPAAKLNGIRFALSAKAQTRVGGFGGHSTAGGFEAGHFSSVLTGARSARIGEALVRDGDKATHAVLDSGVVETMSGLELLPFAYQTKRLSEERLAGLPLFHHKSLEENAVKGDYPNAVQLVMGAAVAQIGAKGVDTARRLVDSATRGAA